MQQKNALVTYVHDFDAFSLERERLNVTIPFRTKFSLSPLAFGTAGEEMVKQLQGPFYFSEYRRNK